MTHKTTNAHEVDYLLINLMEECAEVIRACSKAIRFGIAHNEPGYGHNGHEIANEMGQVHAAYDLLIHYSVGCTPLGPQSIGYEKKCRALRSWLDTKEMTDAKRAADTLTTHPNKDLPF